MEIKKIWKVGDVGDNADALAQISEISASLGISSACAKLLYLRGYRNVKAATDFVQKGS